jgi:DNA uptake protein ComE-like DNA-binding protein
MVILVVLIALVVAAPYVYQLFRKDTIIDFKDFDKVAAQLNSIEQKSDVKADGTDTIKNPHPVMFAFNPNSLSASQWQALGLSLHQASVILHYEAKGGHFYQKTDLKKIYAITAADYTRLEPYIAIPDSGSFVKTQKAKPGEVIELNTADSARLTELNGIGPSFAVRIVRYRGLLGGFIRKDQLMEVYDIDSAKYNGLKNQVSVDASKVKKIDINTVSFNQLRLFPYLNYKQVNAIIQYRQQHGNYASMADVRNVIILDENTLTKIEPYLNFK